jgi:hypothetical protein
VADSEVRQKFEARVLETVKYAKRDDFVIGENGYNNPNLQEWFGWFAAGMRAGEIAMREKAAKLCEREVRPELDNFNDLNRGWNEALTYAAGAIRAGKQEVGGNADGK